MSKEIVKEEFVNGKLNLKTIKTNNYSISIRIVDKVVECTVSYNGTDTTFFDKTFKSAEKSARAIIAPPKAEEVKSKTDWFKWLHKKPTKEVVEIPQELVVMASKLVAESK